MQEQPQNAEFLDIQAVAAEIRRRVQGTPAGTPDLVRTNGPATQEQPERILLTRTEELCRYMNNGSLLAGKLPAAPATPRGRIGQVLVRIVHRMLFWYTPPLRTFQRMVAHALSEQAAGIRTLYEYGLGGGSGAHNSAWQELTNRLQAIEEAHRADLERCQAAHAELGRRLEDDRTETMRRLDAHEVEDHRLQEDVRACRADLERYQAAHAELGRRFEDDRTEAIRQLDAHELENHRLQEDVRACRADLERCQAAHAELGRRLENNRAEAMRRLDAHEQENRRLQEDVRGCAELAGVISEMRRHADVVYERLRELEKSCKSAQAGGHSPLEDATAQLQSILQNQEILLHQVATQASTIEQLGQTGSDACRSAASQAAELARRQQDLQNSLQQLERYVHATRSELIFQEKRLSVVLEEARRRLPAAFNDAALQTLAAQADGLFDPLYAELEDVFRGSRRDIMERLEVYLPYIRNAGAGTPEAPILDLGCGRGEWLELLRDNGLTAAGVDINIAMVEQCRLQRVSVTRADAMKYLAELPSGSQGSITAFHLVEHLPLLELLRLLDETVRVLKPGGLAIFETPNPANLLVASQSFYLDPTHRNPVPSALLRFLAEARGLCSIELLPLHPYPSAMRITDGNPAIAEFLNYHFYGPQDYAVIGAKM